MKKIFIPLLLMLGLALGAQNLRAQAKVGYFNIQKVLPQLPDYKTAQQNMDTYAKQVEEELKSKQTEFETKYKDYQEKGESLTPALRASRERELANLERQFNEFQQNIQADLQNREAELLAPLYQRVEEALNKVAKAEAYEYVLKTEFCVAYDQSKDVSNKVLKELGVTPTSE